MPGPLHALHFVHNAIRREVAELEQAVAQLDTADALQFAPLAERFATLGQFLYDHEHGEEDIFFPALEAKAPHVITAYELDHRNNDEVMEQAARSFERLESAPSVAEARSVARELFVHTVALRATMQLHLMKEERHLLPVTELFYSPPEQGAIVGRMSAATPPERYPQALMWLFSRLSADDRAGLLGIMKMGAPPVVFQGIAGILADGLPTGEWLDLQRRVGLPAAAAQA